MVDDDRTRTVCTPGHLARVPRRCRLDDRCVHRCRSRTRHLRWHGRPASRGRDSIPTPHRQRSGHHLLSRHTLLRLGAPRRCVAAAMVVAGDTAVPGRLSIPIDYLKFHREAAYHLWSAKAWGLILGAAVIALLGFNTAGWLLSAALIVGILCDCEGLLISCLLYECVEDVPHLFRALRLRRDQKALRSGRALTAISR
jgi:hypothetical protein